MNARPAPGIGVHIAPAQSPHEWASAALLTHELVDWMTANLGLDSRSARAGLATELSTMSAFYAFPRGIFLLAWADGTSVGTTGVHLLSSDTAEIRRVYVSPAARGQGIAKALLTRAVDAARVLGASRVRLETEPQLMSSAVQMYRAAGFEPIPHYSRLFELVPTVISLEKKVA